MSFLSSLLSKKDKPIPLKKFNYENIHCDEFLELLQTISELIDKLGEDSKAFSKNTEWTRIHQDINDCRVYKNQIMDILNDWKLIAERYTASIAISNFQGLEQKVNVLYESIAMYQQKRQPPSPDAGSIQQTLLRCKGGVGDCIRYIEKTFIPSNPGTWSASKSPGSLRPPSQLLEMRACLDAW